MEGACRNWKKGYGCYMGDRCTFHHSAEHREVNKCHRWQRYQCWQGDSCPRIHEMPEGEPLRIPVAAPDAQTLLMKGMKRMLTDSMEQDKVELDQEARRKKFKWYEGKFHPDKWMYSEELRGKFATPTMQWILNQKDWYLA